MMIKLLSDVPVVGAKAKLPDAVSNDDFATTLKDKMLPVAASPVLDPVAKDNAATDKKTKETSVDTDSNAPLPQVAIAPLMSPALPPVAPVADPGMSLQAEPDSREQAITPAVMLQSDTAAPANPQEGTAAQGGMVASADRLASPLHALPPESPDKTPDDGTTRQAFFLPVSKAPRQESRTATDNSQPQRLTEVNIAKPEKQPESHPSVTAPEAAEQVKKVFQPQPQPVQETIPGATMPTPASHSQGSPVVAATASGVLEPQPGTPAWQHALGQQLTLFTRNGIHNAELRLHPEELGSLQINLRLNNDQAQIHFVTASQQVKAALEAAMPHLRTLLDESGINLGQSSVGSDAASWGAFSQSQQGFDSSAGQGGAFHSRAGQGADTLDLTETVSEESSRQMTLFAGVNTFV